MFALELSPTPVGPITSAAGSVRSAKPDPITVIDCKKGSGWVRASVNRATVPLCTTLSPDATVPFKTLVTNRSAMLPASRAVMSQGPLMSEPKNVSTTLPLWSSTSRHPAFAVAAVPSVVGKLPTITHPLRSTTRAVVKPTPPGHRPGRFLASISANKFLFPSGEIWTMVVPVPWRLAALLKLLPSRFTAHQRSGTLWHAKNAIGVQVTVGRDCGRDD